MEIQNEQAVFERVREAVAESFAIDINLVTRESRFKDDLHADSIDIATLLMVLEEELDTHIDEAQALTLKSVDEVVKFVLQSNLTSKTS